MGSGPQVADWNSDGKKDLIVGDSYNSGRVRIYLNSGTDSNPIFTSYTYLKVGGSDFMTVNQAMPEIVDWNSDGKKDVLCGEINGRVYLLINTGSDASPSFSTTTFIQYGSGNLDAGSRSAPVVADWDQDGRKDLIVGESGGKLYFYKNTGTDAAPILSSRVTLRDGGSTLDVANYSRPDVADWDNDGVLDIMCGNRDYNTSNPSGGVWFFGGNVIPADEDSDDLRDKWERENWGDITSQTGDGDADNDGQSNVDEQNCGADPTDNSSSLRMESVAEGSTDGTMVISWQSIAGFNYKIERSTDLTLGWSNLVTGISATPPVNTQQFSNASSNIGFYRIQLDND